MSESSSRGTDRFAGVEIPNPRDWEPPDGPPNEPSRVHRAVCSAICRTALQYSDSWKFIRNVSSRTSQTSFLDRRIQFCSDCAIKISADHAVQIGAIA